jgi:hypothetical protein
MFHSRFPALMLGPALAVYAGGPISAAHSPADPDYETVVPAHVTTVAPSSDPTGYADSPLVITEKSPKPHPRQRFVMRDGTVLIGQILASDGQMYALRLPHSTLLARKDLFVSIGPVTAPSPKGRTAHVATGARF